MFHNAPTIKKLQSRDISPEIDNCFEQCTIKVSAMLTAYILYSKIGWNWI